MPEPQGCAVQFMVPTNVPVKITAGSPSVPLPVIENVLPAPLNVPPPLRVPEVSAPVVKLRVPQGIAVEHVPNPIPLAAVKLEPVSVRPAVVPARVPPVLPKSTLPAN